MYVILWKLIRQRRKKDVKYNVKTSQHYLTRKQFI